MKRHFPLLISLVLIFACSFDALAVFHARYNFIDFGQNAQGVKRLKVTPIEAYTVSGTNFVTGDPIIRTVNAAGSVTISNMLAGSYRVEFSGSFGPTIFTNSFGTNVTGLVNAADPQYLSISTNLANNTGAYSQAAADARFALKSGDTFTGDVEVDGDLTTSGILANGSISAVGGFMGNLTGIASAVAAAVSNAWKLDATNAALGAAFNATNALPAPTNYVRATGGSGGSTNASGLFISGSIVSNGPLLSVSNLVPVNAAAARTISSNAAVMVSSPLGGGDALAQMSNSTPRFEGQLMIDYYGDFHPHLWFAGSTTAGDYKHSFAFPAGIASIGDPVVSDPSLNRLQINLNGSPTGWTNQGDSLLVVANWSTNSLNSGSGIGPAVMRVNASSGRAEIADIVGCTFNHIPTNKSAGLAPGNAELVFNTSEHLKALLVCSPSISGFDSGNYSIAIFDFQNKAFRIPKWVAGKYQPSDSGYTDAVYVSPVTGHQTNSGNLVVIGSIESLHATGLIKLNTMAIHSYTSDGGTFAICDGPVTADYFYLTKNTGLNMLLAGQGIHIKEGSNATLGVATLSGGSNVVSNTKVTASSRIFLTVQSLGTVTTPKAVGVTARSAGTSFTISSSDNTDTSTVAWQIVEPF